MEKRSHHDHQNLHGKKTELPSTYQSTIDIVNRLSSPVIGSENDLRREFEALERNADYQSKELEINECMEFVAQLVDLFKHNVILLQLQLDDDWQQDHHHQFQRNKRGATGNLRLDDLVEKTAIRMGLTKEQWKRLLYMNLTTGDNLDMTKVTRSHLKKVHDMSSRLLEGEEQSTVFALIDAIEKHMPDKYFIPK